MATETVATSFEHWRRHTEATEAMTTTEAHRHRGDHDRGDHHTEALEAVEVKRHHMKATTEAHRHRGHHLHT